MSEQNTVEKDSGDGVADAIAAVAAITVVIAAVVYWLSGLPS